MAQVPTISQVTKYLREVLDDKKIKVTYFGPLDQGQKKGWRCLAEDPWIRHPLPGRLPCGRKAQGIDNIHHANRARFRPRFQGRQSG